MGREKILKRRAYLDWINAYCGQTFDEENLPGAIELAIEKLIKREDIPIGVSSQTVGDISISYTKEEGIGGQGSLPFDISLLLAPYVKMRTI